MFGEPDLSTISRIDARGNVNLYLVGDVHVAGSTVNEAQKIDRDAPTGTAAISGVPRSPSPSRITPRALVTVDGQVKTPGPIPLPTESTLTVYQAIIRAGGFTDIAKGSAVTVTRILPGRHQEGVHGRRGRPHQGQGPRPGKR